MPAPFAALETRVNRAVFSRLSNVQGLLDGVSVAGIFDNDYQLGSVGPVGMASSQPALQLLSSDVPANPVGKIFINGATTYTVAEHLPDGAGASVLMLERTP